jgi:hypothetical protein
MSPLQNSALRLPQQDLERCSYFDSTPEAATAWAEDLPLGSPVRAGSNLRSALSELNRVPLPPEARFRLLEILRDPTHSVIAALNRSCLNQPIILDEDSQIQSDLVRDLCALIGAGYTLAAIHTIQGSESIEDVNPARLACESLHRAVVYTGERVYHSYLLYQPMELNCWASLHQLYALSERQQLAKLPVKDPVRNCESSIVQEYLAPLLLACSKPNQLRQHDIAGAFRAFQTWRDLAKLQDPELGEGLFAVDMNSDQPPVFAELLVRRGSAQFRYINTAALIKHLEELKFSRGSSGLRVIEFDRHTRLDTNLLEHMIKALGEISQRNFARQNSRLTLHIASGLSNVHYFVAGEKTLQEVVQGDNYDPTADDNLVNPFLVTPRHGDKWQSANPEEDFEEHDSDEATSLPVEAEKLLRSAEAQDEQARDPVRHVVYSVRTTNTSPGGYCVEWTDPPGSIHIGDVVCVREAEQEHADWTIAVIRWVSQVKHAPTLLGLELLSPRGTAYGAQVKMSSGQLSRPIRVLLLPEIPLVGQTHTLIVPRMVFREGQRINITRFEDAFLVKLKRQVASTGYFSQMDFEYVRQLDDDVESSSGEDRSTKSFSSIWTEI